MSEFDELKKPKRQNYVKKVERKWSHDEIIELISAVEERRLLWDMSIPEYKLSKTHAWQEVANAIGNIKVDDAKAKWMNLRISFKNNMAKYRLKKSQHNTDEEVVIPWRYFDLMMFLEAKDNQQSTESKASLLLTSTNTDASVLTDFSLTPPPHSGDLVEKRKRRRRRRASPRYSPTPPPPSPTPASSSIRAGVQYTESDKFSVFGDYIVSELRALPPDRGAFVQRELNRELIRLLELVEESPDSKMYCSLLR